MKAVASTAELPPMRQAFEPYRKDQAVRLQAIEGQGDRVAMLNAYAGLFAERPGDGRRPCLYLVPACTLLWCGNPGFKPSAAPPN